MVEIVILQKVDELQYALGKTYGDRDTCNRRFFLKREGLRYDPKNGKTGFATHKINFVRGNGRFFSILAT